MEKTKSNKYCPTCGKKNRNSILWKIMSGFGKIILTILVVFGVLGIFSFVFIVIQPELLGIMTSRMRTNSLAEVSHVYNEQTKKISDNITTNCKNITCTTDEFYEIDNEIICAYTDLEECKISEVRDYMVETFDWENDWMYGSVDSTYNMIVQNMTKGDCEDWSVTICNIFHHMDISCRPVMYGTSICESHVIVMIKRDNKWEFIEPQHRWGLWKPDNSFGGFIV